MDGRLVGLLVGGGASPLAALGLVDDPALTPFAGRFRFLDFAVATLANADVAAVYVAAPRASAALRGHVLASTRLRPSLRRPLLLPTTRAPGVSHDRVSRLASALAAYRTGVRAAEPTTIVALQTDHILKVDARELARVHRTHPVDLTLLAVPRPAGEPGAGPGLRAAPDGTVAAVDLDRDDSGGLKLSWTGDAVISAGALAVVTAALARAAALGGASGLAWLCGHMRIGVHDLFDGRFPRSVPYWHDPATVEDYYDAHLSLCSTRPVLDLSDPTWPILPAPCGLGPARVAPDGAGHPPQVLSTLLSDGAVVRAASTRGTVLGCDTLVDAGAEVEDSIVFDGARIGRNARVRRALIGPGVVVGDEEQIGYEAAPPAGAQVRPSGLTVVMPFATAAVAAGAR